MIYTQSADLQGGWGATMDGNWGLGTDNWGLGTDNWHLSAGSY